MSLTPRQDVPLIIAGDYNESDNHSLCSHLRDVLCLRDAIENYAGWTHWYAHARLFVFAVVFLRVCEVMCLFLIFLNSICLLPPPPFTIGGPLRNWVASVELVSAHPHGAVCTPQGACFG